MRIPFGSQSYQHEARQLSSQRMINCFLEKEPEGSKSAVAVIRSPGIEEVVEFPESPIRGGAEHRGDLYFVSGTDLYAFSNENISLGNVPGIDRVQMFSNGIQLGILANRDLYVYEETLTKVTDPGFYGAIDATYLDLFGVFIKPNSADIFINSPAAPSFPDLTDFDALDFRTAEAQPGNLIAAESDHRELFLFKEDNTEIWTNTGNADFPFEPIPNAFMELGCIARDSIAKADNTLFWLANDMTVRRAQGYTPVRVSTHAIENAISKFSNRSQARAFSYPHNGHLFYALTFPSDNTTFAYDITTGLWHERQTNGVEWRAQNYIFANDTHYVADSLTGKVGKLSGTAYTDFGDVHRVSLTSPTIHSEGREIFFSRLHVDFEMGRGITTGQGSDPQAMLQWSDDGGRTWSSEYWRSMGRIGEYAKRAVWHRLGSSRSRVFRLTFSEPTVFTLIDAFAEIDVGGT